MSYLYGISPAEVGEFPHKLGDLVFQVIMTRELNVKTDVSRPTCDFKGPTLCFLISLNHQLARLNSGEISGSDDMIHVEKQVGLNKGRQGSD